MKTLEVRRHSCTKKGDDRGRGSHLGADGVALAREVARDLPDFDYVMASTVPRTLETAIAMGYAVDDLVKVPSKLAGQAMVVVGHLERWSWEFPWLRFRELAASHEVAGRYGEWLRDSWIAALDHVPEGGRALVVTHGRDIELGVLACLPHVSDVELKGWGEPVHQCEGVTMTFDRDRFSLVGINRTRRCESARRYARAKAAGGTGSRD